jgi:hypothetical protein
MPKLHPEVLVNDMLLSATADDLRCRPMERRQECEYAVGCQCPTIN